MTRYQSLLIRKPRLRAGGTRILQVAVHRHSPETSSVFRHAHPFAQILVYLTGHGWQETGEIRTEVTTGTVVVLPPGCPHSFRRSTGRRPLCLAIDLEWQDPLPASVRQLPAQRLAQLRHLLAVVVRESKRKGLEAELASSAAILEASALLLGVMAEGGGGARPAAVRTVERLLAQDNGRTSIRTLAERAGYQQDAMNRLLRREVGLTLGQWRAEKRLTEAKQLLREGESVGEASRKMGFRDVNYFTRWFRKQAGLPPRRWSRAAAG